MSAGVNRCATRPHAASHLWVVVALLSTAVFINYVDRGALSVTAPLIVRDLHLTNTSIGILLSAFFWVYAPGQLIAGWLAQRLGARTVLAAGLVIWSLATLGTAWVGSFTWLLCLRLLLGFGETAIFPATAKILAEHTTDEERGTPNGVFVAGMALGPVLGTLAGGLIAATWGWRAVFIAFGAASLLWLAPWLLLRKGAVDRPAAERLAPAFLSILRRRGLWGVSIAHFASTYALYFMLTWLPLYLVHARHFSLEHMAVAGAAVYSIYALSSAGAGWISDRLVKGGMSASVVRKTIASVGAGGIACAMLLSARADTVSSVAMLCIAGLCLGLQTPMLLIVGQTFAGPHGGGRWMGVQNALGNTSGIVAPVATGWIVDRLGGFEWAFTATALMSLVGLLAWQFVVGPIKEIEWSAPTTRSVR